MCIHDTHPYPSGDPERAGSCSGSLEFPPRPPRPKLELVAETFDGVKWITDCGSVAEYLRAIHVDLRGAWHTISEIAEWYGAHWRGNLLFGHNDGPDATRRIWAAAAGIIGYYESRKYRQEM